jgi:hypothetical protein
VLQLRRKSPEELLNVHYVHDTIAARAAAIHTEKIDGQKRPQ